MITAEAKAALSAVTTAFKEVGITPNRAAILQAFEDTPRIRMSELAEVCGFSTAAGTGLAKSMIKEGLLIRRHCKEDLRAVWVYPTKKGQRILAELVAATERGMQ